MLPTPVSAAVGAAIGEPPAARATVDAGLQPAKGAAMATKHPRPQLLPTSITGIGSKLDIPQAFETHTSHVVTRRDKTEQLSDASHETNQVALGLVDEPNGAAQSLVPRGSPGTASAKPSSSSSGTSTISTAANTTHFTSISASFSSSPESEDTPAPAEEPALSRSDTSNTLISSSSSSHSLTLDTSAAYITASGPAEYLQQHLSPATAGRKTSPGFTARLKSLGFGSSKTSPTVESVAPQQETNGGLVDEQPRQPDDKHQANPLTSLFARRGSSKPWKGPGVASNALDSAAQHTVAGPLPQLPQIRTPEPLNMDTQKYRLPDHTNGNGIKVTLDTRREHIERTARPLSPPPPTPPQPPRKDTPPPPSTPPAVASPNDYVPGLGSYFTPGRNRPGSIYTLSRASFANQLAQLTSLQLPDAGSLASKVSPIPTAQLAARALINAADQIRSWIAKAQEVIGGLDSEDDVEWAAAGGREGLDEVEGAITRFEELINAYIGAIEELQCRQDISQVASQDLKTAVSQMESIMDEWAGIRAKLQSVRGQVALAMEWEELWNKVLGDVQDEMDELSRLVFEMEESRHKGAALGTNGDGADAGDFDALAEDTSSPSVRLQVSKRLSLAKVPPSPSSPGVAPGLSQDDSSLLALFARMQPLRASLDFLPMRLSTFEARADRLFPTACEELEMRRAGLDGTYKKLEKDAESLRKELGEDRWVTVFRGAGRQAQKMHESVQRSLLKLSEAIDTEVHLNNPPTLMKKIEGYEAKKTHYSPAIERVLSIIDRGVKDRLTVNGEILRLHKDMQSRWGSLKEQIREMDSIVDDIQADRKSQQLRDSVSSMLSNDQSTVASGRDTPSSSPPSSVIMSTLGFDPHTPLPKSQQGLSPGGKGSLSQPAGRRHSSLPAPAHLPRHTGQRLSTIASSTAATPVASLLRTPRPASTMGHRPPWNASTNTRDVDTGHQYKPQSATSPSPYARTAPVQRHAALLATPSSGSRLPSLRNAFSRATSEPPRTPSRTSHSRLAIRERLASPGPYSQQLLAKPRLNPQASMSALSSSSRRRSSMLASGSDAGTDDGLHGLDARPASSLATSRRRTSLLPHFRSSRIENSTGRATPQLATANRLSARKTSTTEEDAKPRWRH